WRREHVAVANGVSRLDPEVGTGEVGAIVGQVQSERLCQLAGARAEEMRRAYAARLLHPLDSLERLDGADQHRRRSSLRLGDRVQKMVHAVGQVDIRD